VAVFAESELKYLATGAVNSAGRTYI